MELPTIATNFGGQLDFMTNDNSFLINCEVEPIEEKSELKWATVNIYFN